jgi:hypothetical protein
VIYLVNFPGCHNIPRYNLNHLEENFSEEEVRRAILQLPSEKAPGPDGFTGFSLNTVGGSSKAIS